MLDKKAYFIREHVAAFKLTDTYDILDPETKSPLGVAKEEPPGWAKWLRLLVNKQFLPTTVNIYEDGGAAAVLSLHKRWGFPRTKVAVADASGGLLGRFESKVFSLGGGFWIHNAQGQRMAEVKGDWKGWNFRFLDAGGAELGTVTKKWAGIGKELFTTADNYMIALSDGAAGRPELGMLLLAAGLAIDIVYKEQK